MSAEDHPSKKMKMDEKVIGTHNGTFHCDEALAVFLLKRTKAYANAGLKRNRDPAILNTCDIVVDVGGVYDEKTQRFDHHQRGFEEVFGYGFKTKLSSAGLVYKHFGREIIANRLQISQEDPKIDTLWLKMYKEFIEAIDAIDNGISQYPTELKPRYRINTDVSKRVGHFNPAWNEEVDAETVDAKFLQASAMVGTEFLDRLDYYANAWLPARDLVLEALNKRKEVDPSGRIVLFESFAPWKEHLFELEETLAIPEAEKPIYVLYPDETANNWRIQAVPVSSESFESRKALPEQWRGVRDDALSQLSGVDGCIFVHASGFIGGNKTKEGVLRLANLALNIYLPSGWDVKVVIPSSQKSWIGKAYHIKDIITGRYYYPRNPDGMGEVSEVSRPLQEGEFAEWISGPNLGRNSSAAFALSSGTIGAALSSALSKVRSIALSYGTVLHPTPTEFYEPAHQLGARIIDHLWRNWGADEGGLRAGEVDLYNVNIPMIPELLSDAGLTICWTRIWRNSYGRLFKAYAPRDPKAKQTISSAGPDSPDEPPQGAQAGLLDATATSKDVGELVFKFAPDMTDLINPSSVPVGTDGWAIRKGWVSVTPMRATFGEPVDWLAESEADMETKVWKMKL
ncbi:hypothetical protein BN946_scf184911.g14 [Trametes cinnabarina]|uniref:Survival protein SurE-like phosphatase/nucleotidase domain-containing protein n=1 Tax=Pycnoporus cinnabarinus TaxID=5643 RepID=A0A060SH25_PYCCI|nr:hypothetical protein BN946_scf184911.g14 [Trametes cinnabarina]